MRAAILSAAALGLLGACTPVEDPETGLSARSEGRQCFRADQVNDFDAEDDRMVHVKVGARDIYRLELIGVCPNIDWSQRIAIRSRPPGSWICGGMDAELVVPSPTGPEVCAVTGVTKLSDEDARAYRERRD